jgi:uncharacterized protein
VQIDIPASIGVISDTHGALDPGVARVFVDVDLIVHAGDIGNPGVLVELEAIAPTVAVRGNTDHGAWAAALPESASFRAGDVLVWAVHEREFVQAPAGVGVIVSGHTHRPAAEWVAGVLHLNPGSATEPRGRLLRPTVARLQVGADGSPVARIHRL